MKIDWLEEYIKLLAKHEGKSAAKAIEGGGYTRGYGLTDLAEGFLRTRGANANEMSDEELAREYVIWNAEQISNKYDNYNEWPSSVQMAAVDLAYNGGDITRFSGFSKALRAGDYQKAMNETLDIVGANDPSTGKRGSLRGLGNRRMDFYNSAASQVGFSPIDKLDVLQSGSGSVFSYTTADGSVIEKSLSSPIHSASGSYDGVKKKTVVEEGSLTKDLSNQELVDLVQNQIRESRGVQEITATPKGGVDAGEFDIETPVEESIPVDVQEEESASVNVRPIPEQDIQDNGGFITEEREPVTSTLEDLPQPQVGPQYQQSIESLIAKDIEENGYVTQVIKNNGQGVASPFLFMPVTKNTYAAAFRNLNPVVALRDSIMDMMVEVEDDPDYDFMQDPQLEPYQDSLLYFMDSRSAVDTKARIDALERERKDAALLSASSSGEAQLIATLTTPSTAFPVAGTRALAGNVFRRVSGGVKLTGGSIMAEQATLADQRMLVTDKEAVQSSAIAAIFGGGVAGAFGKMMHKQRMSTGIYAPYRSYSKEIVPFVDSETGVQVYRSAGASVDPELARKAAYADMEGDALKETGIGIEKVGWNPVIRMLKSQNPIVRGVAAEIVDLGGMMQKKVDDEIAMSDSVEVNFNSKYIGELLDTLRIADQNYLAYRGVNAKDSDIARSFQVFGLQAKDKFGDLVNNPTRFMSEGDFRIRVSKAMRRGDRDSVTDMATPHVEETARRARQHFEFIKGEAQSVRLFETQIRKAIVAARSTGDEAQVARLQETLRRVQENGVFLNTAESYLPRVYRVDKILAEESRFRAILRRHAIEDLNLQGADIQRFIDDVFDSVTHQKPFHSIDDLDELEDVSVASGVRGRALEIDDVKIEDFLENDIEVLLRHHTKQMGIDIELTRKFGSVDMKNVIDEVTAEYTRLINESKDPIKREELRKGLRQDLTDIRGLRDRVRGTYGASKDPHAMSSRFVRAMKSFNVIVGMGGATVSSIPDMFRIAMVEGLENSYRYGFEKMFSEAGRQLRAMNLKELRAAGVAADAVLGLRAQAFADIGDMFGNRFAAERALSSSAGVMFLLNGLNVWNQMMKEFAGNVTMIRMVEDIMMTPWEGLTKAQKEKFLKYGIDQQMAQRIAKQIEQHGEVVDGVYVPNTSAWGDRVAVQRFRGALNAAVDRIIITPGAGDRALWTSTELGSLLTQFKSFGQAATVRMLTSGLQERDGAFWQGAILLVGMAGIVNEIKRIQYGQTDEETFDQKIINAVDRSGILGWAMDVNNAVEKLSNKGIGLRPAFTDEKRGYMPFAAKMGAVGGPTAGNIANLASIAGDVLGGRVDQSTLDSARFLTPYNTLPYADPIFDSLYGQ